MNRLLLKTKQFIFLQQKSIFSSSVILSLMIVVSRIFGFLRYRILAGYYSKEQLDIYFASFRIPDFIFEILITGALTATLIPIFIKYQKNKKDLDENISSIFNLIFIAMTIFIFVLLFFSNPLISFITPGYSKEKVDQIIFFSQILLIGQLPFMIVGNFLTGIGQANKMFFLTAIAPIVYNIAIIVVTWAFSAQFNLLDGTIPQKQ